MRKAVVPIVIQQLIMTYPLRNVNFKLIMILKISIILKRQSQDIQ